MSNVLVLMTALLPTTGHADLIKFAVALPESHTHVLISGRSFEPIPSLHRQQDLSRHFSSFANLIIRHSNRNDAPQNPEDMHEGFWEWWAKEINENFPEVQGRWDYIIASELYGIEMAKALRARFLPYDISRHINQSRGEIVRSDPWTHWSEIIPETRSRLMIKATLFGQESVGKTTLSRLVSDNLGVEWIPEYARPYLETVGEEVDITAMKEIYLGQAALQKSSYIRAATPALILDTDLLSTVGYYEIMGIEGDKAECLITAKRLASDIYYILPDDIPFEEDLLRYGGNHRESDMKFWIDLLEELHQQYVVLPRGLTLNEKVQWISSDIQKRFQDRVLELKKFRRERPADSEILDHDCLEILCG